MRDMDELGECRVGSGGRGILSLEWVLRGVLGALVVLKCATLLWETRVWRMEDPVLPGVPMWLAIGMAAGLEALVFVVLGERDLRWEWKRLALAGLVLGFGAYRVSGMVLHGANISGCDCFGPLGRILTGAGSAALAWGLLGLFGYGAWWYGRDLRDDSKTEGLA
ncbi:MAG: hypothetical protein KF833_21600 [Verrucomicrobiae bacterium]|nr:hypothetical protein [Verrucomicrobiae bacterium]